MSPRTGRPKIDNPKSIDVKVRLDEETNARLDAYCEANKTPKSHAIRQGIQLLLSRAKK